MSYDFYHHGSRTLYFALLSLDGVVIEGDLVAAVLSAINSRVLAPALNLLGPDSAASVLSGDALLLPAGYPAGFGRDLDSHEPADVPDDVHVVGYGATRCSCGRAAAIAMCEVELNPTVRGPTHGPSESGLHATVPRTDQRRYVPACLLIHYADD